MCMRKQQVYDTCVWPRVCVCVVWVGGMGGGWVGGWVGVCVCGGGGGGVKLELVLR